nr:hypothetical protein [Nocardiopsis algeriensis]
METSTIVLIAVVVLAVIAIGLAIAAYLNLLPGSRSGKLKKHFGDEYQYAVESHGDREAAERDLSERLRRRRGMKLRDLTSNEVKAHDDAWAAVQQEFVDNPVRAVRDAQAVVESAMADRGYPDVRPGAEGGAGFEQRIRDLSVDHPAAVAALRRAQRAGRTADQSGTEHLREELVAYRGLVDALAGGLPAAHGTAEHSGRRL